LEETVAGEMSWAYEDAEAQKGKGILAKMHGVMEDALSAQEMAANLRDQFVAALDDLVTKAANELLTGINNIVNIGPPPKRSHRAPQPRRRGKENAGRWDMGGKRGRSDGAMNGGTGRKIQNGAKNLTRNQKEKGPAQEKRLRSVSLLSDDDEAPLLIKRVKPTTRGPVRTIVLD
jgi:hypothetical protein